MKAIPRSGGYAEQEEAASPIYFDPRSYVHTPDYDDATKYDRFDPLGLKDHPSVISDSDISSYSDTVSNSYAETPVSSPEEVAEHGGPGQLADDLDDEKFWENYEKRMARIGATSQEQCLFPPMFQTRPSTVQPDLLVQPPDAVLSAVVLRRTEVTYLCRWDNYFKEENASVRQNDGREGRSTLTGNLSLYAHVSKEKLTEHCPQLLQTFDDYNSEEPESPVQNSVQDSIQKYRDGDVVAPNPPGTSYRCPQHIWCFPNLARALFPPSIPRAQNGSIGSETSRTNSNSSIVPLLPDGGSEAEKFLEKIRAVSASMGITRAVKVDNDDGHQRVGSEAGAVNLSSNTASEQVI